MYYDTPASDLSNDLHTLRHRTRDQYIGDESELSFDEDLSALLEHDSWQRSWERVQYKSSPTQSGAVWFRHETGDEKLSPDQVAAALNGDTLYDQLGDDPVAQAEADHPGLAWLDDPFTINRLDDVRRVVDFRYRILFREPGTKTDRYEVSLDKVQPWTKNAHGTYAPGEPFFEFELEAIVDNKDHSEELTESEVQELLRLANWFESEYPTLVPSTISKGSNAAVDAGTQALPPASPSVGSVESRETEEREQIIDNENTRSYHHPGDANLDGTTDRVDFQIWDAHKFTEGADWASGDFNGDGATDLSDFNIWNAHKFTSTPSPAPVDTVFGEVGDSRLDALPNELAWQSEADRSMAGRRTASSSSTVEAAVDRLLASYREQQWRGCETSDESVPL